MRPYRDDSDYFRMRRFVQSGRALIGPHSNLFHAGDITWQRFANTRVSFIPEERIALWERPDGELDGFAWYYPKRSEFVIQIDPRLKGTPAWERIADEMVAWADQKYAADQPAAGPLTIPEFESDTDFAAWITGRGFIRSDAPGMRYHYRELGDDLPTPTLPEGFVVRSIDGSDAEIAQRVEIHREVWHPSKFTVEGYTQLRNSPGYDPDLDLVAVAPDGAFAAYTICWHDEVTRSGEFEPVGAREAFRGQGITKAVMHEGLRRLRAKGCDSAYVYSYEDNASACGLYLAAGFQILERWISFQRPAANAETTS